MSVTDAVGDQDYFAYGFHGTTDARALTIRLTRTFEPSDNFNRYPDGGDWLGEGFYFWQDAPTRVWQWLRAPRQRRLPPPHTVIVAKVNLTRCLDLLDTRWHQALRNAHTAMRNGLAPGEQLPINAGSRSRPNWHRLDDAVLRRVVSLANRTTTPFNSVRGAFEEGDPIFPGSALFDLAHVEIAVLEDRIISDERYEARPPWTI